VKGTSYEASYPVFLSVSSLLDPSVSLSVHLLSSHASNWRKRLVKGKGEVVPVLHKAPRHEGVLGEWRYSSTHSLTSVLDGGEWSASLTGRFTSRERAPGTHLIRGLVDPRDAVVKREIPSPCRDLTPRSSSQQPSAIPLSYPGSMRGQYKYKSTRDERYFVDALFAV
jgi:hypothetical protein